MKSRTMIYLEPEEHASLRREAKTLGISLAELIRRLVRQHFTGDHRQTNVPKSTYAKIVAMGSSGRTDVSEQHDHYLGEAIERDEHPR
ncbi:MAG: CopG family transcriptional regulator [Acidiferrobacterales bacterium]